MKRIHVLGFLLLFFVLIPGQKAYAATPVEKWGQLSVKGAYIVNEAGKKVQLKGASTHGIAWFPQYVNTSCFKSLKKMGANTVRLALYSDPAAGYTPALYTKVEEGVKAATKLGMYVILDWHILTDGNPATHQKQALHFFTYFSQKYGKQKNILYEICNEPNGGVTWEKNIRPYAKKITKRIRKYDKKNLIIVGTPTWSQDVDIAAQKPLSEKNMVYALHFYAATHREDIQNKLKTAHKAGLPILVSEFSICESSGNGTVDKKSGNRWMKLLKKYKTGYIAWNISNKNETSAMIRSSCQKTGAFTRSDLSKTGRFIAAWWKK